MLCKCQLLLLSYLTQWFGITQLLNLLLTRLVHEFLEGGNTLLPPPPCTHIPEHTALSRGVLNRRERTELENCSRESTQIAAEQRDESEPFSLGSAGLLMPGCHLRVSLAHNTFSPQLPL